MTSYKKYKVLVAPLDWGLGHATRCIPVIRGLLANGHEVVIGAENAQAVLLQQEFPALKILPLRGYRVKYSRQGLFFAGTLLLQLPGIWSAIRAEHRWLAAIVETEKIDLVISDNRYGLYHPLVPCIFITHQLTIKAPFAWLENGIRRLNYRYINRFKACWVPDMADAPGIAGLLSHPTELPAVPVAYINLLCRFTPRELPVVYKLCVLLSGPEPQRSLLEEKIIASLQDFREPVLLVRGKPAETSTPALPPHVTVVNHLPTAALSEAILQSELVICRSGYTTVMELLSLKKKMILVPTPGQTEQVYLGKNLMEAGYAFTIPQQVFHVKEAVEQADRFSYQFARVALFNENSVTELLIL